MEYIDNLLRMDAINFWRSEYTKRNMIQLLRNGFKSDSPYYETKKIIDNLKIEQDPNLGDNVVRYTLCALLNRSIPEIGDSDYDIDYLSKQQLDIYKDLLRLSYFYGYSADKLFENPVCGLDLVNYIETYKKVPYSHPSFRSSSNPFIHIITNFVILELMNRKKSNNFEYYPVGMDKCTTELLNKRAFNMNDEFLDRSEIELNNSDASIAEKIIRKCFYTYLRQRTKEKDLLKNPWAEKEKNHFIETCKKIYPESFHIDSSNSRAIGIYLWDCAFFYPDIEMTECINRLRAFLGHKKCGGPSNTHYSNLLAKTKKCIDAGNVLKI